MTPAPTPAAGWKQGPAAGWARGPAAVPFLLAQSGRDRGKAAIRAGKVRPFPQILGGIQNRYHGRLSDARLVEGRGGAWTYRVKWLTPQGNILAFTVNAQSGQIMGVRGRGERAARKR